MTKCKRHVKVKIAIFCFMALPEKKERGETQGSEKDNKNLMELDAWVKKAR